MTALALAGTLEFEPAHGTLTAPDGKALSFTPPEGDGAARARASRAARRATRRRRRRRGRPGRRDPANSERLQLLEPFLAWDGQDFDGLPILVKTKGKTTTDHISPAGPWLRFRGHLDKISDNMFLGAVNAFTGEAGKGVNVADRRAGVPFAKIARDWKAEGQPWMVVGDENYGEGSSREHAAMSPRYLGARESSSARFARIHETNLKKQGSCP